MLLFLRVVDRAGVMIDANSDGILMDNYLTS